MKRLIMLFLTITILSTSTSALASSGVNGVILNGKQLNMDVKPVVVENRTLVPARALLEALGLNVSWSQSEKIVRAEKEGVNLDLVVSNNNWDYRNRYNGIQFVNEDTPPKVINNRTLIPVRFVAETLGLDVKWNAQTKNVIIQEKNIKQAFSIDDAYQTLNRQYPNSYNVNYFYLPFGGYAYNNDDVMANYYVFGIREVGDGYESIADMNFCVHKNTGNIEIYDSNGFHNDNANNVSIAEAKEIMLRGSDRSITAARHEPDMDVIVDGVRYYLIDRYSIYGGFAATANFVSSKDGSIHSTGKFSHLW